MKEKIEKISCGLSGSTTSSAWACIGRDASFEEKKKYCEFCPQFDTEPGIEKKTYKAIVYAQGNSWVLSDKKTEQLPYWVQTKQQVREFLQARLDDRWPGQYKLRITWA